MYYSTCCLQAPRLRFVLPHHHDGAVITNHNYDWTDGLRAAAFSFDAL